MKSFIKSHKRNESIQSTTSSTTIKSPLSSPSLNYGSTSNSNSPKKLLVPIKNLFHKRRPLGEIGELYISKPIQFDETKVMHNIVALRSISNSLQVPNSKLSISSKRSSKFRYVPKSEEQEEDDDDSSVGSTDSNFSFVKDTIGGRNTSVKYYKTKKAFEAPKSSNPFIDDVDHDLDIDDDYDFENNGLDDYDIEEDGINYIDSFEEPILQNRHLDSYDDYDESSEHPINSQTPVESNMDYSELSEHPDVFRGYRMDQVSAFDVKDQILHQNDYDDFKFNVNEDDLDEVNNSIDHESQVNILAIDGEDSSVVPHSNILFNKSYHMSLDGFKSNEDRSGDALDLLENYLETDYENSTSTTPRFDSIDDLELYDLDSPLINGITVGDGFTTRFKNISPTVHSVRMSNRVKSLHLSIDEINLFKGHDEDDDSIGLGIMPPTNQISKIDSTKLESETSKLDLNTDRSITSSESQLEINKTLQSLESGSGSSDLVTLPSKSTGSSGKINRQSINEMMSLLETLQTPDEASQRNKRDSIENMMSFLKTIQKTQPELDFKPKTSTSKPKSFPLQKKIKEEQEWEEKDEKFTQETSNFFDKELELNDLERDLIDEVNQLPEDFDFNANQDLVDQFEALNKSFQSQSSSFTVSNSFKKKPKKILPSPLRNTNIIETSNKTVTYYNHSRSLSTRKSHSPIEDLTTISERN